MKIEDIEFLKQLQNEMLTQDDVGQASPRFWTIKQPIKIYGTDLNYDGKEVIYNGEILGESLEDLYDILINNHEDLNISYNNENGYEKIIIKPRKEDNEDEDEEYEDDEEKIVFYNVEELIEHMIDYLNYDESELSLIEYKEEYVIVENTMFLTLKECEKHLKANKHHYHKNAHPYCMTAWRSPQVKRLIQILEKTNWDNVKLD